MAEYCMIVDSIRIYFLQFLTLLKFDLSLNERACTAYNYALNSPAML